MWAEDRSVRITASRFGDVLARTSSKRYQYYMEDLIESLNGHKKVPKTTPWFDHGREMEEEGLLYYEWLMDRDIEKFGCEQPKLFIHPKYDFIGCSPDALDNPDGMVELKCHTSYLEYEKAERAGIPTNHIPQVQGQLWIKERKWCNFVSYYRNGDKRLIHIHTVKPDLKYHKKLEIACIDFWDKIHEKRRVK